jgi:hypothetical protein
MRAHLSPVLSLSLSVLLSCAGPPDPCTEMCAAAAELYGGCLTDWGVDWAAAGYADVDAFTEACETWAWEQRLLEEDAIDRGRAEAEGRTDAACEERETAFRAEDAECTAYTELDWQGPL